MSCSRAGTNSIDQDADMHSCDLGRLDLFEGHDKGATRPLCNPEKLSLPVSCEA